MNKLLVLLLFIACFSCQDGDQDSVKNDSPIMIVDTLVEKVDTPITEEILEKESDSSFVEAEAWLNSFIDSWKHNDTASLNEMIDPEGLEIHYSVHIAGDDYDEGVDWTLTYFPYNLSFPLFNDAWLYPPSRCSDFDEKGYSLCKSDGSWGEYSLVKKEGKIYIYHIYEGGD